MADRLGPKLRARRRCVARVTGGQAVPTWEPRDGRQVRNRVSDDEECTRQLRLLAEWRVQRQSAIRDDAGPVSSVGSRRCSVADGHVRPVRVSDRSVAAGTAHRLSRGTYCREHRWRPCVPPFVPASPAGQPPFRVRSAGARYAASTCDAARHPGSSSSPPSPSRWSSCFTCSRRISCAPFMEVSRTC